jgi:hypothetical protein
LAIAFSVYWFIASNAFAKRLDAANGHEIAPGVTFQFASKTIGGFPFRVDAVLENVRVDAATSRGPASWQAEHFALHMLDYGGAQFVFEAAGKQVLTWHDKKQVAHGLAFTPALLRASAIASGGELKRFDLMLYGAVTDDFSVAHSEFHIRRDPKADGLDIAFMADNLNLPGYRGAAMGPLISKIRLGGTLLPASPWNALLSGDADWRKTADAWRGHRGAIDIQSFDLAWGKTETIGNGLLMLDNEARPQGIIKLKIAGYQLLAEEAAREHLVNGAENGVLAGLMAAAAASEKGQGALPLTLAFKDGIAYAGDAPVGFADPVY